MSEMHTNTDTDADKYILNGVEVTPNEFIDIVTNFLEAQHSRVVRLNARIAELEAEVTKCHELQDAYCDRIAELEAAQRWIPVSERLPELKKDVLAGDRDFVTIGHYYLDYYGNNCFSGNHLGGICVPTHWMPLPEPPIVYGKVCEE